ncbi:MAG: hypothetical protein RMK50_04510 [Nitrososphaerota archaeon]|nr:hypothetical protein [Candidatus Bathyarchaeota archaeon]MDW8194063.1 hypothetical protein [Nitrososphaerota archaeon]
MYAIWLKVDDSLPWIELECTCETRQEANRFTRKLHMKVKVVRVGKRNRAYKPGKTFMLQSEVKPVLV